jgi:hypothetical protein
MNKKQIAALIEAMVQTIVAAEDTTEDVARTLIGLAIQKNQAALTTVSVPTLAVQEPAATPSNAELAA